jgi:hypothetical protein
MMTSEITKRCGKFALFDRDPLQACIDPINRKKPFANFNFNPMYKKEI